MVHIQVDDILHFCYPVIRGGKTYTQGAVYSICAPELNAPAPSVLYAKIH